MATFNTQKVLGQEPSGIDPSFYVACVMVARGVLGNGKSKPIIAVVDPRLAKYLDQAPKNGRTASPAAELRDGYGFVLLRFGTYEEEVLLRLHLGEELAPSIAQDMAVSKDNRDSALAYLDRLARAAHLPLPSEEKKRRKKEAEEAA